MSTIDRSRFKEQLLAAVMSIGLLGLLAALAAGPFLMADDLATQVETRRAKLAILERQAALRDRLKGEQARSTAESKAAPALLAGGTFGLASAALQKQLVEGAQAANLAVRSIQALEPSADGDFSIVPVRVVVKGTTVGLQQLLHGLETGEPMLFVDELNVKPERSAPSEGPPTGPVELTVELRVSGYVAGNKAP